MSLLAASEYSAKTDAKALRKKLQIVSAASDLMLNIVNKNLDFGQLSQGKMSLESVPFSGTNLVSEVTDLLQPFANTKGIKVLLKKSKDIVTLGDPTRLKQILTNLIGNAIKFSKMGDAIRITLDKTRYKGKESMQIQIKDEGEGIAANKIKKLFKPFTQENDTSTYEKFGGSGLGLNISMQLANLMNGTITVESPGKNKGSTFSFIFPITESNSDSNSNSHQKAKAKSTTTTTGRVRRISEGNKCLIIDDNRVSLKIAQRMVKNLGFKSLSASCGKEGIAAFKLNYESIEFVLCDLNMPDLNGDVVAATIKEFCSIEGLRIPVFGCSAGSTDTLNIHDDMAASFDTLFQKPLNSTILRLELIKYNKIKSFTNKKKS